MSSSKVVGSIFFARDELLWVEELAVSSGSNFINDSGLKIHEDSSWDMLASTSFTEKSIEGIVRNTNRCITVTRTKILGCQKEVWIT